MAIVLFENGETRTFAPENGTSFSLKELQDIVKGYIEFIYLPDNSVLCINEEGKMLEMRRNNTATMLAKDVLKNDFIVGPAVWMTRKESGEFSYDDSYEDLLDQENMKNDF